MLDISCSEDPGLMIRMNLRCGQAPDFNENDLKPKNQEALLTLLKNYVDKYDIETGVGLAISLARIFNDEDFGLVANKLPVKNLLSKNINEYVADILQPSDKGVVDFFTV